MKRKVNLSKVCDNCESSFTYTLADLEIGEKKKEYKGDDCHRDCVTERKHFWSKEERYLEISYTQIRALITYSFVICPACGEENTINAEISREEIPLGEKNERESKPYGFDYYDYYPLYGTSRRVQK